ncbi:uncharacterized protein KIAA1614 homolog isoform X2 [Lemur catta]|uniref:uncharacterized protein KIAA1614 homolog isoform X2 n=1 Tax=Lemur catta TaxID=9447 RepID=UPI001E26B5DB|nr:uncharacterized protein KIAA1614 homolog isoform X2 [Lemur catta]
MEGMQAAAAKPAGGGPPVPKTGSRAASPMEVTSAVERSGPEPPPDKGHFPLPWPCPRGDRPPSLMAPRPPRAGGAQLQGPSVLESKVRALKEKMTAGKQGAGPCPTAGERSSPKKPKHAQVKAGGAGTPSEGAFLPDAAVVPPAQNLTDGQRNSSDHEEEPTRNGGLRPPSPPAPGCECWNGPPEAMWTSPGRERGLLLGPGSLLQSPVHRVTPGRHGGPGPGHKIIHVPSLRKGSSYLLRDCSATGGDLDSTSLTSEEDFGPRTALPGGLWRAGDLGAAGSAPSLSERVERSRLLLQEMLSVSRRSPCKAGAPGWTPSGGTAAAERPAGDVDWDAGSSLQDSERNRIFGPKPEPVLSPRHEEAQHLLQRARMKARTRPLRASHDIVPTAAPGSRDGQRSPAPDPGGPRACSDGLRNGDASDCCGGEADSGQRPKRGPSPSHVRFEDESAGEAEVRYLERLQRRHRQARQAGDQGPLRSKPDLAAYISGGPRPRDAGKAALLGLVGSLDRRDSERTSRACGSCRDNRRRAPGQAPPDPRVRELQAACGVEAVLAEPPGSRGLCSALRLLPEWVRETHIGDALRPEGLDPALGGSDTPDSGRTSPASPAWGQTPGGSPRLRDSGPGGGHRWSGKAETEPPWGLRAQGHLPGVDDLEVGDEVKESGGHTPEGTLFRREDAVPAPPALDSKPASLASRWQPGPGPGNHWDHPVESPAPGGTACAMTPSMKLGPLGPGSQAQVVESHESLETVSTSSLRQSNAEPPAPHRAQQPPAALSPEGWVPTPPPPRKATSPGSHRKPALVGPRRLGDQGEPVAPSRSAALRTCERSPPQTQAGSPHVRHRLLGLSTNNCNNRVSQGLQEPPGDAVPKGRVETGCCSQEPEPPAEHSRDGGLEGFPGSTDVTTVNATGITLSLFSEEPEPGQEPEGAPQRTESGSGGHGPSRAPPGASAAPGSPSAAPSDKSKRRSSIVSTLGLKKFFSALGQSPRPKLGKSRSYSVEPLHHADAGAAPHARAPSLQSLHPVSPSHHRRKAASFQNLHSLLSGKRDRSSLYLVGGPGDHSAAGRPAKPAPRRALSVEDVGAPSLARTVGRVAQVFPDGTSQLQLQRSPEGTFGFCVASGNGRRDSGIYVQEMADSGTAKLYSGLLGVGDEILEVNGAKVAGLGLAHITELLAHSETLSIRVLRQRPAPR